MADMDADWRSQAVTTVEIAAASRAEHSGYLALADIATLAIDYRIIGGQTVSLHVRRPESRTALKSDSVRYQRRQTMSDVLIRDVPDDVLAAIDKRAARLGLSRTEYVRRRLAQDASAGAVRVDVADLRSFADKFADLGDPDVMSKAWD